MATIKYIFADGHTEEVEVTEEFKREYEFLLVREQAPHWKEMKQKERAGLRCVKNLSLDKFSEDGYDLPADSPNPLERLIQKEEHREYYRKREMPRFLKDAGFKPDNITWFAALHTNKKHRHIHISFFENAPTRIRQRSKELQFSHGKINQECIRRFKVHVEQNLTDISAELRIARKEATNLSKEVLFSKDSLIRYNNAFQEQILDLVDKLPPSGRISYDSENMRPLKPLIDKIVDTAIKSNRKWYKAFVNFCAEAKRHDDRTQEILIRQQIPEVFWPQYMKSDTYLDDMYRRLGNQVLNYVRIYRRRERPAKGRLARKRIRRKTAMSVLAKGMEMQAALQVDSMYFFEEYLRKLEEARADAANQEEMEKDEME